MGTKVRDAPSVAGVECPKKTGEMDESEDCTECQHWRRCWNTIMGVLEEET